jgi:hypothetical protein
VIDPEPELDIPGGYARPRRIGIFHLTWGALMQRTEEEDIGYLVVQRPFGASSISDDDTGATCFVSIEVPRLHHSLGAITVGTEVCRTCSRPIDPKRLNAIPMTKRCKSCQELKEKR